MAINKCKLKKMSQPNFQFHVYLMTLAGGAENQLWPVSQTITTVGAVCMNLQSTSNSSATEKNKSKFPQVLHYTTSSANGIYWFIWHNVNLWSCLFSVKVSKCGSKQTKILLDTPVIPRWVCSLSEGATAKTTLNFCRFRHEQQRARRKSTSRQ